ncbi:MAG: hypothetical protein DI555_07615 [Novosphingobium pentaromativorans]|uniref:Uncharacterized protein n=1 Tax=Novosphingobium pentaromativorans TaxID=205844 RepID=A0A2W5NQS6_9SPHN|nr:MAG: hypothetical protein DI555_07615 [Novosphingobium pentaromativorans]
MEGIGKRAEPACAACLLSRFHPLMLSLSKHGNLAPRLGAFDRLRLSGEDSAADTPRVILNLFQDPSGSWYRQVMSQTAISVC